MSPSTIENVLEQGRLRLIPISETATLDAQVLLGQVLGKDKSWLLAHLEYVLSDEQSERWEAVLATSELGVPLPYVIGEWEFYGLKMMVTPAVLIPRPETEFLVENGLKWLAAHPGSRRAADVGTGSGCIAIALAENSPDIQVVATDKSPAALYVSEANVKRYHLEARVYLAEMNLMEGLEGPFDLICANLPYIPEHRLASLAVSKWEPYTALNGGFDGLRFIEPFLNQAATHLAQQGVVLAEIDARLENAVKNLATSIWSEAKIQVRKDLSGLPRLLIVETE